MDHGLTNKLPPVPNTLWTLHVDKRKLLLHIIMLLTLSLHEYGANAHVFLLHLASFMSLSLGIYQSDEIRVAQALAKAAIEFGPDPEQPGHKSEENKAPRQWKVALDTGSGHMTLAGHLTSAGIGTMQGGLGLTTAAVAGLLGAMADHGHLMGNLFGINPVRPTSKMLEACGREI